MKNNYSKINKSNHLVKQEKLYLKGGVLSSLENSDHSNFIEESSLLNVKGYNVCIISINGVQVIHYINTSKGRDKTKTLLISTHGVLEKEEDVILGPQTTLNYYCQETYSLHDPGLFALRAQNKPPFETKIATTTSNYRLAPYSDPKHINLEIENLNTLGKAANHYKQKYENSKENLINLFQKGDPDNNTIRNFIESKHFLDLLAVDVVIIKPNEKDLKPIYSKDIISWAENQGYEDLHAVFCRSEATLKSVFLETLGAKKAQSIKEGQTKEEYQNTLIERGSIIIPEKFYFQKVSFPKGKKIKVKHISTNLKLTKEVYKIYQLLEIGSKNLEIFKELIKKHENSDNLIEKQWLEYEKGEKEFIETLIAEKFSILVYNILDLKNKKPSEFLIYNDQISSLTLNLATNFLENKIIPVEKIAQSLLFQPIDQTRDSLDFKVEDCFLYFMLNKPDIYVEEKTQVNQIIENLPFSLKGEERQKTINQIQKLNDAIEDKRVIIRKRKLKRPNISSLPSYRENKDFIRGFKTKNKQESQIRDSNLRKLAKELNDKSPKKIPKNQGIRK